jgi:protein SCO1/2
VTLPPGAAALPASAAKRAIGAAALLLAVALSGCGGSGAATTASGKFKGLALNRPMPAPALALHNYNGAEVNLKQLRGKAVLVTFIYTHCPDVCPLIVGNLHTAQHQLGAQAGDLQIIAVSVDPHGDTPATVTRFLKEHQMTGKMDYLIGSRSELERTWKRWQVGVQVPKNNPALVEHSAEVLGIDASGVIRTAYPSTFRPTVIVHDVPLLAAP